MQFVGGSPASLCTSSIGRPSGVSPYYGTSASETLRYIVNRMEKHLTAGADLAAALSVVAPLKTLVDEYGELDRLKQLRAPDEAREKYLKEQIELHYANLPAATATVAQGDLYAVQISARENRRVITDPVEAFRLLKRQLGMEAVMALITIPLTEAIDKFIPVEKHPTFLFKSRSGPRKFHPVAKVAPRAA
jgi:hypothetical protein